MKASSTSSADCSQLVNDVHIRVYRSTSQDVSGFCSTQSCAVLLLHGWMGCGDDVSQLASELANANLTVLVPDLPFHGKSIKCTAQSPAEAAEILIMAASTLVPRRKLFVVGYSMGGRIVLETLRLRTPPLDLVGTVIMSAALPCSERRSETAERELDTAARLGRMQETEIFENWLRNEWYGKAMWGAMRQNPAFEDLVKGRLDAFSRGHASAWAHAIKVLGTSQMHPWTERYEGNLLYLYGENDTKYTAMAQRIQTVFENAQCECIESAAHNVVFEELHQVVARVLAFALKCDASLHMHLRIRSLKALRYSLPLIAPMLVGESTVASREGSLVCVLLSNGHKGVADLAPLPGWHSTTINDAEMELKGSQSLRQQKFCVSCHRTGDLGHCFAVESSIASACLESALHQALCASTNRSVGNLLQHIYSRITQSISRCDDDHEKTGKAAHANKAGNTSHSASRGRLPVISLNGVLPRDLGAGSVAGGDAQQLRGEVVEKFVRCSPFNTLKLKVGSFQHPEDDAMLVKRAVAATRHCKKSLRLDANRAWTRDQWTRFRDLVADDWVAIEYIEEPLTTEDCEQLEEIIKAETCRDVRIALDETVADRSVEDIKRLLASRSCVAIVLKTSMFPSVRRVLELIAVANNCKKPVVLSSAFESGVGLAWQALFASCVDQSVCHGLGTFAYLAYDALQPSFAETCLSADRTHVNLQDCEGYLRLSAEAVYRMGEDLF